MKKIITNNIGIQDIMNIWKHDPKEDSKKKKVI